LATRIARIIRRFQLECWGLAPSAGTRLIGYLRATTFQVGVLLHFGPHPKFYRFVDSMKKPSSRK
jgi:hypothetical protein